MLFFSSHYIQTVELSSMEYHGPLCPLTEFGRAYVSPNYYTEESLGETLLDIINWKLIGYLKNMVIKGLTKYIHT